MTASTTAPKIVKSDAEWRDQLTPEQYRILREHVIGSTARPAGAVFGDRQRHHHLFAHTRLIQVLHRPAGHEPVGQVIGDVAYPGQTQLFQWLHHLGSDAVERFHLGE